MAGKGLIITEKPSVAKDVTAALGGFEEKAKGEYYESDDFICTYAVGHILTLLEPEDISSAYKRWRLADLPIVPEEFKTKPVPKQKNRLGVIKKLIERKDVAYFVNACDAAREGELIFREIVKFVGVEKPVKRLWLQSMTKKAIQEGFLNLQNGQKYEGLAAAAECRANADWLIGMNATRALTVRLKSKNQRGVSWSAGRVQTPTLSLLVEREMEVLEHISQPYWTVQGNFEVNGQIYDGTWYDANFERKNATRELKEDRIFEKANAEQVIQAIVGKPALASEIRKPSQRQPPLLFDLTSLQRTANTRFGWSATRTLRAAQRCYETHKVLTYPRTSSKVLPEDYRPEVERVLGSFGAVPEFAPHAKHLQDTGLLNQDKIFNNEGVTDHFAIIPTGELRVMEGDDQKLFDLVARQFMAAFYPPSIYEEVERTTVVAGNLFRSRPPRVLKQAGWEAVFGKVPDNGDKAFAALVVGKDKAEGVTVQSHAAILEEHETKPPARISEAGLLSLMENAGRQIENEELSQALRSADGLGTAATRADIIENLKNREYVDEGLRPTPKGIRLIDILHRVKASRLTSAELTGQLELFLNEVEAGQRTASEFMLEIGTYAKDVVDRTRDFDFENIYPEVDSLGPCPNCSRDVFERAWFYGCSESTKRSDKKACDFLIWKDFNGRYINPNVVRTLIKNKATPELDGFKNANGKSYKATLGLENGKLVRQVVENSEESSADSNLEVNEEPIAPCPLKCEPDCMVKETPADFACLTKIKGREAGEKRGAGFNFPRMLCKRELKRSDLVSFLETKETPIVYDFISKKGRKFSAKLVMENDWNGFRFEFPPRGKKVAVTADAELAPVEGVVVEAAAVEVLATVES
ncbi:MAG: topoisomerase C-terminal repeat-containing protein [Chitinophagaceae bacterium]|nr:topoisomerase C-terminal repeat-containing protein [Oligoflexus sp.]